MKRFEIRCFRRHALGLSAAMLLIPLYNAAQQNDAGLWTSFAAETAVSGDLTAALKSELRFEENVSRIGTVLGQAELEYKLSSRMRLSGAYRFIRSRRIRDYYESRHRYYFDLTLKQKINKKCDIRLRNRWQTQYAGIRSSEDGTVAANCWRSKLTLRYEPSKAWNIYAAPELFVPLSGSLAIRPDGIRYSTGIERNTGGGSSVELFLLLDKELLTADPLSRYIVGLGYKASIQTGIFGGRQREDRKETPERTTDNME